MAAAPTPDQLPDSVTLNAFSGLKNTVTRERLAQGDLEAALNVDLDDAGQLRRRRGFAKVSNGNFHSIWSGRGVVFGVKDGVLGIINPDYSFVNLQSVGPDALAYTTVGDRVFFASLTASGVIEADNSVSPWGAVSSEGRWLSPVVNPTSTLHEIRGKLIGSPPMATALCSFSGRIYLANGRTIWATELYLYDYVDKTRNFFQMETEVTGLCSVSDGFFVGTADGAYFMSGALAKMSMVRVSPSPVVPGSMIPIPADLVNLPPNQSSKEAVIFMTGQGMVVGTDGGSCFNLTQDKMVFPSAQRVAALFRRQDGVNQYIGVADSGGSPASSARIGDYVDVEIRRFQGA